MTVDKQYYKEWRNRNKQYLNVYRARRAVELQHFIAELKHNPCTDCGLIFLTPAMDFDHVKPGKNYNISQMAVHLASKARILREIELCELVCSTCHRTRTHTRRGMIVLDRKSNIVAKELINKAKDGPCGICGIKYLPNQMDLDHINPASKQYTISSFTNIKPRPDTVLEEIAKCRILCAKCHIIWSLTQSTDSDLYKPYDGNTKKIYIPYKPSLGDLLEVEAQEKATKITELKDWLVTIDCDIQSNITVLVNKLLGAYKITQGELAKQFGVSRPCISRWQAGTKLPQPTKRKRIFKSAKQMIYNSKLVESN